MINSQAAFVVKILLYSAIISIFIKFSDGFITVDPKVSLALVIVFLPSIVVALILSWQYSKQ